jgi:hypothetical protein
LLGQSNNLTSRVQWAIISVQNKRYCTDRRDHENNLNKLILGQNTKMVGRQTVHGCRALFYTPAKNIDGDPESLKRDLISAALRHKSETEMEEVYHRGHHVAPFFQIGAAMGLRSSVDLGQLLRLTAENFCTVMHRDAKR